ncbi:hypothetical protein [Rhodonellum sp.]|uniref:DUF7833 domain-containing protein n=1 Tax=Rhodonellum sp. TaxID=2231180 RepID=UPI00271AC8A9|nr:hypothetical protein [Rhodonellum sp.]MDO9553726.1 hypothetical protein [Rhodonellum sp.]
MEEKAIYIKNIFYLPTDKKLYYLIGHILNRWEAKKRGCFETNEGLAKIWGCSESTINKDLRQLKKEDFIAIDYPGQPGKRTIKPSEKLFELLSKKTQTLIEDKKVKYYPLKSPQEGKELPQKEVDFYPTESKLLPSTEVNYYPHNSIIINTINNNIIKDFLEKKDSPLNVIFENWKDLFDAIKDSIVYDKLKHHWETSPTEGWDFELILKHWTNGNIKKQFTTLEDIESVFKGYLKRKIFLTISEKDKITFNPELNIKEINYNEKEKTHLEIFNLLFHEIKWLELIRSQFKCKDLNEVAEHLQTFKINCIIKEDFKTDPKNAKSHFLNWIKAGNPIPPIKPKHQIGAQSFRGF